MTFMQLGFEIFVDASGIWWYIFLHNFQGSPMKTQSGSTRDGIWKQMSGCLQPWQWCIGLLKASTTCFSIILASTLTGSLSASIWCSELTLLQRKMHFFSACSTMKYFFHTSSEGDQPHHIVWKRVSVQCPQATYSKNRNNVRSVHFSLYIPRCSNSIWFCCVLIGWDWLRGQLSTYTEMERWCAEVICAILV